MEGITAGILLLCLIRLSNANTSPVIHPFVFNLCEDIPRGDIAFTIQATDAENDPLTYSLTGPNAAYFTVDASTGVVRVKLQLDREANDLMQLGVVVSDGPNHTPGELNLILLDANDNKPIFQESSYDAVIPENTVVGSTLFRVHATDGDTAAAGVVQYRIDEVTPSDGINLFSIVSTTGVISLRGQLNYTSLSTFYRLKITATDGGGKCYYDEIKHFSSVAFSFITVTDVPDLDPQFISLPVGRVEENSPVDSSVLQVKAIDQDIGVNDDIFYTIEDSTSDGLFQISRDTGVISVLSHIDREVIGDTVTLTVKATESRQNIHGLEASTTANVQIHIIDLNDNKPEFYKCGTSCEIASDFEGEVAEHSLGAVSINMTLKDLDKTSKTELLLEGEDKDVFSVEPQFLTSDSVVQLLVKQPQMLDFEEKQQIVLKVVAIDQEDTSVRTTATVTINIKDMNDNSPKFPQDTFKLTVKEHSPAGTILANITAEDPDTMDQGNITYKLLPESILLYFDVEPHTGAVYVKNKTLLDREVRSLYSATLQARDTDNKPGTTVLEITVTDINDQHPVFNRDSYLVFVEEEGQFEMKIGATDGDDSNTVNSQIVYGIEPGKYSKNFTINPNTGVLKNSGELDREALDPKQNGRIKINVTATDKGTPPLSSVVTVIINVEDINDNAPKFEAPSYTFSVKEGEKGGYVGSVYAEDSDQTTDFSRLSFSIIDGSFGSFIIRTFANESGYRGNITVDPDIELDYESTRKHFKLRVEAADLEQKKAVVMVEVDVLDVNDERPEFKPMAPVKVKENTTYSEPVGSFTAQDKDGNHSLVYELESMKCRCNNTLTPCSWFILNPIGEVKLNPEYTVDYEECDLVEIEAQVVDEYTEKGENNSATTGKLVIEIADINDNAPEFIQSDSVFVVVSESASQGTLVAKVTATDRDTETKMKFQVTSVKFEKTDNEIEDMRMLFEAESGTENGAYIGRIYTTEKLDISLKGKYLVTITATDDDTGGLHSSTTVEIFTVGESYKVELQFTKSVADVHEDRDRIVRSLTAATKAAVHIVSIKDPEEDTEESRSSKITNVVAYFVYSNGTALTSNDVEKMVSEPEHYLTLSNLGLMYIGKPPVTESEIDPVKYILLGMVGGLIIVVAVLITSLMCTRTNFKRKLKAAKAMNSASMVISNNQKTGPVVPGTNKYTMEGANPVHNINIDTSMALDMDEENSDIDKVSVNSMDDTEMTMTGKDMKPDMWMIREEEEDDSGPPGHIGPLGAALAQRGQNKDKAEPGFVNPVFSTTDL